MNKESLNKNLNQNQNVKTGWEDVADYLPKNLENSQDNEKRERSFEKIGEYTVKNIEKNTDGSYNFLGINPENALSLTNEKFLQRFKFLETKAQEQGKDITELSIGQMNELWEASKKFYP